MFKTYLEFSVPEGVIPKLFKDTSWQEKDIVSRLMCKYIPSYVKEILPEDDKFIVYWIDSDSYYEFMSEPDYMLTVKKLNEYLISVKFLPA